MFLVMMSAPLCTLWPISPFWTFSGLQEADFYSLTLGDLLLSDRRAWSTGKRRRWKGGKESAGVFAFLLGFCSGLTFLAQTNPTSTIAPVYGPYSMATVPRSSIYVLLPFAGSSDLPVKEGKTTYLGLPATPSCSLLSCHKSCLAPRLKMSR